MRFSRQEYWSGLPCPPPGDLPDPGIKPKSLMPPGLAGGFLTTSATWEAPETPACLRLSENSLIWDSLRLIFSRTSRTWPGARSSSQNREVAGTRRPNKEVSGDEERTSRRGHRLSREQSGAQGSVREQKGPWKGLNMREEDGSRESEKGGPLGRISGQGVRKRDTLTHTHTYSMYVSS